LIFYKNKGSAWRRICLLCQQTSLENMNKTSNCDVTNSAHQIQMTAICHWMKTPMEVFCVRHCSSLPCAATNLSILICKSSARTKQSVISVALKIPLEVRLGICIWNVISASTRWLYWFHTKLSPSHFTTALRPCQQRFTVWADKVDTRLNLPPKLLILTKQAKCF